MSERKIIYLLNPISGTSKKDGLKKLIERETTAQGIAFEMIQTNVGGNYDFLSDKISRERITDVVMIGGDGAWRGEPSPATLYLYVEDVDAAYKRALQAGATSIMEPANQPYGDRLGGVKDAFGNTWYISTHIEDVPL